MKNKRLLNKRVKVGTLGGLLGGSFLLAMFAGLIWHRRDLKRLVEITRM